MQDSQIIELLIKRSDDAITQLSNKYGNLCHHIAYNITENIEDTEECINDTYFHIWDSIPPHIPQSLCAYISKTARNIAINRVKHDSCQKRCHKAEVVYSELLDSFPSKDNIEASCDNTIVEEINNFLATLDSTTRILFIRRYFDMEDISSLAKQYNMNKSTLSTKLNRARKQLRRHLEKKGVYL